MDIMLNTHFNLPTILCRLVACKLHYTACYLLQIVGIGILGIGIYAWYEKQMFENISTLTDTEFFVDPGLIFIIVGAVIFVIGFSGCVGALRENTCLLMFVSVNTVYQ